MQPTLIPPFPILLFCISSNLRQRDREREREREEEEEPAITTSSILLPIGQHHHLRSTRTTTTSRVTITTAAHLLTAERHQSAPPGTTRSLPHRCSSVPRTSCISARHHHLLPCSTSPSDRAQPPSPKSLQNPFRRTRDTKDGTKVSYDSEEFNPIEEEAENLGFRAHSRSD
ncbi:uncharacterized protein LOC131299023 [Rhododendron vialii]|uniref:uncharacterized protein LOC131299023 n=1 Tax=Rhododendron vialii TaxID=182163 RepID=UPI00265F016A|nr:uncharacterized protein LOC131299023 [Rhododendron vialii]